MTREKWEIVGIILIGLVAAFALVAMMLAFQGIYILR